MQNIQKTLRAQQSENNLIKKWTQDLNIYVTKEDIHMTNTHVKKYSTSLVIRRMQTKIMRYQYTLLE